LWAFAQTGPQGFLFLRHHWGSEGRRLGRAHLQRFLAERRCRVLPSTNVALLAHPVPEWLAAWANLRKTSNICLTSLSLATVGVCATLARMICQQVSFRTRDRYDDNLATLITFRRYRTGRGSDASFQLEMQFNLHSVIVGALLGRQVTVCDKAAHHMPTVVHQAKILAIMFAVNSLVACWTSVEARSTRWLCSAAILILAIDSGCLFFSTGL